MLRWPHTQKRLYKGSSTTLVSIANHNLDVVEDFTYFGSTIFSKTEHKSAGSTSSTCVASERFGHYLEQTFPN